MAATMLMPSRETRPDIGGRRQRHALLVCSMFYVGGRQGAWCPGSMAFVTSYVQSVGRLGRRFFAASGRWRSPVSCSPWRSSWYNSAIAIRRGWCPESPRPASFHSLGMFSATFSTRALAWIDGASGTVPLFSTSVAAMLLTSEHVSLFPGCCCVTADLQITSVLHLIGDKGWVIAEMFRRLDAQPAGEKRPGSAAKIRLGPATQTCSTRSARTIASRHRRSVGRRNGARA